MTARSPCHDTIQMKAMTTRFILGPANLLTDTIDIPANGTGFAAVDKSNGVFYLRYRGRRCRNRFTNTMRTFAFLLSVWMFTIDCIHCLYRWGSGHSTAFWMVCMLCMTSSARHLVNDGILVDWLNFLYIFWIGFNVFKIINEETSPRNTSTSYVQT